MMPRRWTEEAIDNVLTRIRAGEKTADIAAEFGISQVSLRSAIHRHRGAVVRKAREELYGDMSKLWQDGVKIADIASRYHMPAITLASIAVKRRDLFPRRYKKGDET